MEILDIICEIGVLVMKIIKKNKSANGISATCGIKLGPIVSATYNSYTHCHSKKIYNESCSMNKRERVVFVVTRSDR